MEITENVDFAVYGALDLPEGTVERPLVTFALFAYNQQNYIREAIEGAFSQTYCPLEIILSDDCSSDQTYQIMRDMAEGYQGPHQIIVRKSPVNRGLLLHIQDVAEVSKGEILVVAAGDDTSLPERTLALVTLLQETGAEYAESNFNKISENGTLLKYNVSKNHSGNYLRKIIEDDARFCIFGATAVYKKSFIFGALRAAQAAVSSGGLYHEDALFSVYGTATRSMPANYVAAPLVDHRINFKSISNFTSPRLSFNDEHLLVEREIFLDKSWICLIKAIEEMAEDYPSLGSRLQRNICKDQMRISKLRLLSNSSHLWTRLSALTLIRNSSDLRVFLPRIFGPYFLTVIRMARNTIFGK